MPKTVRKDKHYIQFILLSVLIITGNKVLELVISYASFDLLATGKNILIGLISDIFFYTLLLVILYPVFRIIITRSMFFAHLLLYVIFFLSCLISVISIFHFNEVGIPLDVFVYHYSIGELLETAFSFENSVLYLLLAILGFVCFSWLAMVMKKLFTPLPQLKFYQKASIVLLLFVIGGFFQFRLSRYADHEILFQRRSKCGYFARKSLSMAGHLMLKSNDLDNELIKKYQELNPGFDYVSFDYPLLHTINNQDVLSPFFNLKETPPDIYILITEGLANDFLSFPDGTRGLMPFLDSIKNESLYFENFFTTGERSYAAVPGILGSLPHGLKGFTLTTELPYHHTLLSLLRDQNYFTSFFYGQGANFHNKDNFLKYNKINTIYDKSCFPEASEKIVVGIPPYFWGYNDKDLLESMNIAIRDFPANQTYLNTIYTGSMHSPFMIREPGIYEEKVNEILRSKVNPSYVDRYMKYLKTIPFTDDAIKYFFTQLKKSNRYANSIFFITGDHPMTEIPIKENIKRYHVPLIIFSPMLKKGKLIRSVSSHWDIAPSIVALLKNKYHFHFPEQNAMLGTGLDTMEQFRNIKHIYFMEGNRTIVEMLWNNYYISDRQLYKLVDGIDTIHETKNTAVTDSMRTMLNLFNKMNEYVYKNDKLYPYLISK